MALSGMTTENTPPNAPRCFESLDHRRGPLAVAEPHEAVPGVAGGEDQSVHQPAPTGGRVADQAHAPEVDLKL